MSYRIRIVRVGECDVRNDVLFADGDANTTRLFLYVWALFGPGGPILIDTGPKDVDRFNRTVADYIPGGIRQRPQERTPEALAAIGVRPESVRMVIATHLHPDHYEYCDLFPNAVFVANRHGFLTGLAGIRRNVMEYLAGGWPDRLRLVEDETVAPGVRTFWLGVHSPCSQAVVVETRLGAVVFPGDVVYLYRNLEEDRPIGWADPIACRRAFARIRRAGSCIVPAHDPELLDRFPDGWIG